MSFVETVCDLLEKIRTAVVLIQLYRNMNTEHTHTNCREAENEY
jgi:hypothetical protein